jgi:hypothetical protein
MNTRTSRPRPKCVLLVALLCLIVQAATAQTHTILHSFVQSEGMAPAGTLVHAGGTLYGTTASGGYAHGSVFRVGTDGSGFTPIHLW